MTDPRSTSRWKALSKAMRERYPECAICGSTERLQTDHIIPVASTADTELYYAEENLRVLCGFHNNSKHDKTAPVVDWINVKWLKELEA